MVSSADIDEKFHIETRDLNVSPRLLLGPGPSNAPPRVLRALGARQVGHMDPQFIGIMNQVQDLLRYTFQTSNRITIPVSGAGSAAMESTFANLIEQGDVVLIFVAGYFGLRMVDMAERYGGKVITVKKPWGTAFTNPEIASAITKHQPKIVGIVHADTSTGARQPLEEIGAMCRKTGALLIVDAVTSLGGIPLFVDKWLIDACYSGSQKCLSCPPGIAPVTFNERAMEKVSARQTKVPNWYLDISMVSKFWGSDRTYHHTAPINMNYALRESLRIVAEEGLIARWERHARNAERLCQELKTIGLECLVPEQNRLTTLISVKVPDGIDAKAVCKYCLDEYNLEIGGGLGDLAGKIWRIGLMGFNSRPENVVLCTSILKEAIQKQKC